MSTPQGTLLVIGSGPGIGVSTASLFASHGFKHIILTSRNAERLTQEAETVKKAAAGAQGEIRVDTLTLDLAGSKDSLNETFGKVDGLLKESGSELEVVLYNGARVGPSVIGEWDVSGLEEDLRITTISLYTTLNWAVPHLLKASSTSNLNPAFLVTSGGLYKEPYPFLFSLSVGKAAQHNLIESYHRKFEPKIHVALVPISGMVKDDSKVTTPKAVAETFWELYGQKKGAGGKLQIEMEDPDYYAGVEAFRKHIEGE